MIHYATKGKRKNRQLIPFIVDDDIGIDGKQYFIGAFNTVEDAIEAKKIAEKVCWAKQK